MKTDKMQSVLVETANKLRDKAGPDYEVITENQKRKTRNVISVGKTTPNALREESQSGTLARALTSLEKRWSR